MASAVAAPQAVPAMRRPAALVPVGRARLIGFGLLGTLGALEWQRMVAGMPGAQALAWVLVGVAAGAAVLACDRLPPRLRAPATIAVALVALPAAWVVADLDLGLFRVSRWPELTDGIARGAEALSSVTLPYIGADPWPARVLRALGALLCVLSGLLAVWPRAGSRGYPFLALVALLILVAVPVVSLGDGHPVVLGGALAAFTILFLLLERVPLRPGAGLAALAVLALAVALPLGAAADKDEPWFDYKSFAESLGPEDPLAFNWDHGDYGPITWSRTGAEVLRVATPKPSYWKVRTLDEFDGEGWQEATSASRLRPEPDLPPDFREHAAWNDTLQVTMRRLEGRDVVSAGTITDVRQSTRALAAGLSPGSWVARSDFTRGDSYVVGVYVPRPSPGQLAAASTGRFGAREEDRTLRIPITSAGAQIPRSPLGRVPAYADVQFAAYDGFGPHEIATYPQLGVPGAGAAALRHSPYARTWGLAQRLRREADSPYAYVLAVNAYLQHGFRYDERPPRIGRDKAPLDAFLFDTKAGYCQHFSAAMALLLRMGGVPARVATGFSPGGYSKARKAWIVRDTDAHSWVEAWFDGIGWVTFDPTPAATPARSQIAAIEANPAGDGAAGDNAIEYGTGGSASAGSSVRGDLLNDPQRDAASGKSGGGGDDGGAPWWAWGLAGVGTLALALTAFTIRQARARREVDAEAALAELQRALKRTGRQAPTGTTLAQLERRLHLSGESVGYLRSLRAGRYARTAARPSVGQRRALRRDLAQGLGPAGRLRVLWALPPRPFER